MKMTDIIELEAEEILKAIHIHSWGGIHSIDMVDGKIHIEVDDNWAWRN